MLYLMVFGKTQKSIQTFLFSFKQFCFLFFLVTSIVTITSIAWSSQQWIFDFVLAMEF